jgi:hypothetical protein
MRIIHQGRHHVLIPTHTRGDVTVQSHWRSVPSTYPDDAPVIDATHPRLGTPQSFAPPTNAEPVELFGGKQS